MSSEKNSYRNIMKATSIFGGVQVFNIIIHIVRSKFVAILLGPSGMGISGLLVSSTKLIGEVTNFGLGTSAVKNISAANATGDEFRIATVITVLRRLVWLTGLLGAAFTLFLSPWLSQISFGNSEYTNAFIWISITLLFAQLSSGQLVLLQGMRKTKLLAKANLYGHALGLFLTVPLYYVYGINGIVPSIIISSIVSLFFSWSYSKKFVFYDIKISLKNMIDESKSMLLIGLLISLSGLIATGGSYIIRVFISQQGGLEQVGLYTAGFAIINNYTGLIFSAMGTDFYPRLSAVAHNNALCKQTINQQAEIAVLILAPILIVFIVFVHEILIILYSSKFSAVDSMIYLAALGMFFKAASWSVSYIFLAKGDSKLFFWSELASFLYVICLNMVGYYYLGLTGLGLSFLAAFFLYLMQVYLVAKIKFEFKYDFNFIKMFIIHFLLAVASLVAIKIVVNPYNYIVGSGVLIVSVIYSYKELDKRIDIIEVMNKYLKKSK